MRRLLLLALGVLAFSLSLPVRAANDDDDDDTPARADLRLVSKANNTFAVGLYSQLSKKDGNVFFSPFSISASLGMTSSGARGDTLKEMEKALALPPQKLLHPAMGHLLRELSGKGGARDYELTVANTLFGQQGYRFKKDFTDLLERHYDAGMQFVDFKKNTEPARVAINAWAQKQTKDRVKDLVQPGVVDNMTKLVLVNAIYFKGVWKQQFDKKNTLPHDFHLDGGKKVKAPLMYKGAKFPLVQGREADLLELPYKGDEVRMVVILPKKQDGLADLEKNLTAEKLTGWMDRLGAARKVMVWLPKFKFELATGLKEPLQAMGMKTAFGIGADLSGMDGTDELYLKDVVHKAFVDVNEKGTEAAAATAAVVATKSAGAPVIPEFKADHPFLFVIRDKKSGAVLFMGRVSDPTK
jgi:serpin B